MSLGSGHEGASTGDLGGAADLVWYLRADSLCALEEVLP